MSDASWDVALPPFDANASLQTLKRFARDQQLAERSEGWLLASRVVLRLAVEGDAIKAQLARRPVSTTEWDAFTLKSAPDLRKLQDEIKRRLLRWKADQ